MPIEDAARTLLRMKRTELLQALDRITEMMDYDVRGNTDWICSVGSSSGAGGKVECVGWLWDLRRSIRSTFVNLIAVLDQCVVLLVFCMSIILYEKLTNFTVKDERMQEKVVESMFRNNILDHGRESR